MGLSFNMSLLKSKKSEFDSEHKHFDNTSYSTYKSSYIRSCPDSYVQQMRNKLNPLYEKIDKGYNNIASWWADYNNDIERLDNVLASNGGTNLIRESAVSVFINSRFWYLFAQPSYLSYYYTPFTDVITLKYFKTAYEQKQWHEERQVQFGNQTFDLTKIEDKDAYIDALKAERRMLEDLYATFTAGAHDNYTGLEADHVHWYNPEECKTTVSEQHEWMAEHGYSTDDWRMDQSYINGREAYYKYIDEVYTPLFNKYFAEYSKEYFKDYPEAYNCYKGITYDQVLARKAEIESQLAQLGVEETIWADLAVFGTSFVEGVAKFGESLVDCGAIVVTGFETAGVFGESLGSWIVTGENTISEDVGALWDSTMGFVKTDYVGDVADKFYDYTGLDQSSHDFESTRALGSGIGKVAGITTLTVATGGSNVLFAGLSGFGEGTERAWQEGATLGEGLFSGALQGSWDSLQWYVGGKINAWNPVSPDVTGAKFFNTLIRVGADGVDSAVEGIVQPLISTIYKDSYYDENGNEIQFTEDDNFFERYGEMWNDAGGWTNVLINGLIGSGSSVLGEISGVSKYFRDQQKLKYLPEKVEISANGTSRTMNTKELYGILTDENKFNRFLEFDKNIDLFPNGSKDEYLIGVKQLIDTANNGKVDLGLSKEQLNKIDLMAKDVDFSAKVDILDNIMDEMGDNAGRRNLLLYAANGNTERIPVQFRDQMKNITADDIRRYLEIDDTKIGAQFFGSTSSQELGNIGASIQNNKNPLLTEFKTSQDAFAGSQESCLKKFKKLFKSVSDKAELKNLEATIKKYYPNMTKQEMGAFLVRLKEHGCTYVAASSSIFEQLNYDAALFYKEFGFDMYLPNGELNHDQLVLDIFSSLSTMVSVDYKKSVSVTYSSWTDAAKQLYGKEMDQGEAISKIYSEKNCQFEPHPDGSVTITRFDEGNGMNNIVGTPSDIVKELLGMDIHVKDEAELLQILRSKGMPSAKVETKRDGAKMFVSDKWLNAYFKNKNIDFKYEFSTIQGKDFDADTLLNKLTDMNNDGYSVEVSSKAKTPIMMTDGTKLGWATLGEGDTGHAMMLRGITDNGELIVSSWGKNYLIPAEFVGDLEYNFIKISANSNIIDSLSSNLSSVNSRAVLDGIMDEMGDSAVKNITDANIKSNVGIEDAKISSQFVENANTIKKYSPYSTEQLMKDKNYQDACNHLLELVTDEKTKAKLEDILYLGGHGDFSISSNNVNVDNSFIEAQRRLSMAHLLITNPETFDILAENNINLFHGTNANALPNILKYGLNSGAESEKLGISVLTGEASTRMNGNQRDFVSFTDVLDIAEDYSGISSELVDNDLSFNVIIGTTIDDVQKAGTYTIHSDTPELGVKTKLPVESIKLIGVPTDKVDFVKKMVVDDKIKVVAIDNFDNRFYYADYDSELLEIYPEYFKSLKESLNVSIDATSTNSILDGIVEKMGNSSGRRNLLLYATAGNIERIPVEFREQIKNITSDDIKKYLGVEDTKIGAQFFADASDNISAKNFDAEEFITTFCSEFNLDYSTHDKTIVDAIINALKSNDIPDDNVRLMLANFNLIKKINSEFSIATWAGNSMYWAGTNQLVMNSALLDNGADVASMTLLHEIGHVFLSTMKGNPANNWQLEYDESISQILSRARDYVKNNPQLDNILQFSDNVMDDAFRETVSWYDGIRESEAKRITDLVSDAFEEHQTDKLVSLTQSALKFEQVQKILKKAGITGEDIELIMSNKELLTEVLVTNNAITKQIDYRDSLIELYSKYGVRRKLQSMLNSLLQSTEPITMRNGKIFNFAFKHDNFYWNLKGVPDMSSYNELFADFFSLQANGQREALDMFREMVGDELYNQLEKECADIASTLLKYAGEGN